MEHSGSSWTDRTRAIETFLELVHVCVTVMAFCCECEGVQRSLEKCESWLQSLIQNIWETLSQEVGNTSLGFRSPEGKQRRASCETVVEWKNVQCRTEREQVGCETLIEVTAERNKPEWILIASWRGSFCLCTYRCFPLYFCKTNDCTMLNGKKKKKMKPLPTIKPITCIRKMQNTPKQWKELSAISIPALKPKQSLLSVACIGGYFATGQRYYGRRNTATSKMFYIALGMHASKQMKALVYATDAA